MKMIGVSTFAEGDFAGGNHDGFGISKALDAIFLNVVSADGTDIIGI